jgi:hypothetical protein
VGHDGRESLLDLPALSPEPWASWAEAEAVMGWGPSSGGVALTKQMAAIGPREWDGRRRLRVLREPWTRSASFSAAAAAVAGGGVWPSGKAGFNIAAVFWLAATASLPTGPATEL